MNRRTDDNTVFVLKKAIKKFRIKVSEKTIKNFLYAHPHYPTLKSVCDGLKKWKIEYYPLKMELSEIKELELPFIAHLNESGGQLAFVEKIGNDQVGYFIQNHKRQVTDFDEFAKKLSGAVVLIEPNQKILEPNYKHEEQNRMLEKMLLPTSIMAMLLLSLNGLIPNLNSGFHGNLVFIELSLLSVLGIIATVYLVMHEFKIHTSIGDKLCGFSSKTDCDSVLSSDASKLFGNINWADAGLIYFTGVFIFLTGSASLPSLSLLAILSALSLPYPLFSVYYQSIKLKKWCPFCLLVQLLLVGGFLVLLPVWGNWSFTVFDFLRMAGAFIIPTIIWVLYKTLRERTVWGEQQHDSMHTLKRNPELFRTLLTANEHVEISTNEKSLQFGNPSAPVTITAFLSLYCGPCASAFAKLKVLLETCPEIKLNAVFSIYPDEETQKLINTIYYHYATKGAEDVLNFLSNWYALPPQLRKTLYENEMVPEGKNKVSEIAKTNKRLFEEYRIAGTPTIYVNGFKHPQQYDYSDLEYFIDDIKQITLESKRQEAGPVHS